MVINSHERKYFGILKAVFSQSDTGYPNYTYEQSHRKINTAATPTKFDIELGEYKRNIHSFDNSLIDFDINFWNSVINKETDNRVKDDYTSSRTLSLWFSYFIRILENDIKAKITTLKNTIILAMYTNHVDTNSIIKWANQQMSTDALDNTKYIITGFIYCFIHFSDYQEEKDALNEYLKAIHFPPQILSELIIVFHNISLNGDNNERMLMSEVIFDNWKNGFHNNMVRCFTFKLKSTINDYSNLLKYEIVTLSHEYWVKIYNHYGDGFISFLSQKRIRQGVDRRWFNKKYESKRPLHFTFYEFYMLTIISGHFDVKAYTEMCIRLLTNDTNRQNHNNYIYYISHVLIYFYQLFIDQIKNNDDFIYSKNDYKSNKVHIEAIIDSINEQSNIVNISKHIAINAMTRIAQICNEMMDNIQPSISELDPAVIEHMQTLIRRDAIVSKEIDIRALTEIKTSMKTLDSIFGNISVRKKYTKPVSEKESKSSFFGNLFHKKKIAIAPPS